MLGWAGSTGWAGLVVREAVGHITYGDPKWEWYVCHIMTLLSCIPSAGSEGLCGKSILKPITS